jgi:putative DNA methylase
MVDPGQSFYIEVDRAAGTFVTIVHDAPPEVAPTLINARGPDGRKVAGKSAVCPFCSFSHPLALHRRLANEGQGRDEPLVVADLDDAVGKRYRPPHPEEFEAILAARAALDAEVPFAPGVPAIPDEGIAPGNNNIIGPSIYGVKTYGDYMPDRQTLGFVRLSRAIKSASNDLLGNGVSAEYAQALATYAASVLVRKVRRSGRAATLDVKVQAAHDIFSNQGSIGYSYDFLEVGLGSGQGTWDSIAASAISTLRNLMSGAPRGRPAEVARGTATRLALRSRSVTAVVTDPPYDQMLAYADSSDVMHVWVKRALGELLPEG